MSGDKGMLLGYRIPGAAVKGKTVREPILLETGDLTTHAICLGATGSGKTGLCIDLLEEGSLHQVPILAVDLKGDLTNLALVFPDLRPEDFKPWIDPDEARRQGATIDVMAQKVADRWKAGLEADGIDLDRRRRLLASRSIRLYRPGSDAGQTVNVIQSLGLPEPYILSSEEALGEAVVGAASALLGLAGLDVEPLRSREHVLTGNVIENAWKSGRGLTLDQLISELVTPPFARVGVFEVDRFMPRRDREELALKLNALIAAPGFALWTRGTPLAVPALLEPDNGRTPLALVYMAHLGERERMFALALLLDAVVRWMRGKSGTGELRLLLYIDEVFGFLPPHPHDPPSKRPLLTLLKQARAFGVGIVLATQNPVDLDYKALSNASTWLLGRLATEPDRRRVLEGLAGASAVGSRGGGDIGASLAALESRQFLLHRAGKSPAPFQSRFAMSYLRGPMTRVDLGRLVESGLVIGASSRSAAASRGAEPPVRVDRASTATAGLSTGSPVRPSLPPGIRERFLTSGPAAFAEIERALPAIQPAGAGDPLLLRPIATARISLRFDDVRLGLDQAISFATAGLVGDDGNVAWSDSPLPTAIDAATSAHPQGASFMPLPAPLANAAGWRRLGTALTARLVADRRLTVHRSADLGLVSAPGESRDAFAARVTAAAEARAADELAKLRESYSSRLERIEAKLGRATDRQAGEQAELAGRKREELIGAG